MGSVLDPVTKDIDSSPLGNLSLHPRQEFATRWAVLAQVQRLGGNGLSGVEEGGELGEVYAVLSVVVLRVSAYPADAVTGWTLGDNASMGGITGMPR